MAIWLKVLVHRVFKFVKNFNFQKLTFFTIITGTKFFARINFERKCFIFMKL